MKIEKFRAKGFIGFKRGLNLDEVSVDFTGHDGLIAFSGQNGTSKSTLMELLSPYNRLASRSGALYQHVFLRDSERELTFSYQGNEYRTLLKIDSQSGKSEGFIWRNGESIVNGKISAYAKAINELFGSPELFYNSVFCQQNATKLSDMSTGELKTLFAEFLRLDRLQDYEETAKQVINVLTGKSGQIDINIEAIGKRMEGVTNLRAEIEKLSTLKAEQETYKTEQIEKLKTSQIEREKLKEDIARNEVLNKQIESMAAIIADMEKNRDQEDATVEAQLNKLRIQYQEYSREIADADKILIDEPAMLDAAEKVTKLTSLTETLTGKIDAENIVAQKTQVDINVIETGLQNLKHTLKDLENDSTLNEINTKISIIEQKIENCTAQLKQMEGRDKDCKSSTCQFIIAAKNAETELASVQKSHTLLKTSLKLRTEKIAEDSANLIKEIAKGERESKDLGAFLRSYQENALTYRKEIASNKMELLRYQNLAAKQVEIAVAKNKKEEREKTLAENKKQGLAISAEWKIKAATIAEQIAKQNEKLNDITVRIEKGTTAKLDTIEINITVLTNAIKDAEAEILKTGNLVVKIQGDLSGITEAEELLRKENENKIRITADIADWTYLKNACGKNGLQAMEIDGAAPLITGYANNLLSRAFGSLYAVKFLTQDEEGKECLDIITIGEDGEEILLDNLSGGQKCWILMALRLAMTLLSKEKGGRNFQAAFFDELDGPLDAENAVNFINLYKSFMEIGHFETVSFISHKEECRSMADHVLMFEAGKTPYWN